ncbi:MAG: TldD/PmbA family protein [Thermoplasmata archaeon]
MSTPRATADTAGRVAEHLKRLPGPWDVFGERVESFEIHFGGTGVELVRGPILVEGYGLRVLRPFDGKTAIGFQASTDATEAGIASVVEDAEAVSRYSEFPAKDVSLPAGTDQEAPSPGIADPGLWNDASGALGRYSEALFAAFEGLKGVGISFGSIKAHRTEVTLANSAGLAAAYAHTTVGFELAVKASGGPEGRPPGEYWVDVESRRLEPDRLPEQAQQWGRYAEDARRAKPPPTGELAVVLPPSVLESILPGAVGFKLSGRGQLRDLSPALGSEVGAGALQLSDDGTLPWAISSSPFDDEGTPQRRRPLISGGRTEGLLYDALYGKALGHASTGSGIRRGEFGPEGPRRFSRSPGPITTTLTMRPGGGGSDAELIEAAGDGIWVQQLGWASPDSLTSAYGGEIRIGYRIRNGKLAEPIRGGTLGGLVLAPPGAPSLFASIQAVGARPELIGRVFVPSVLARPLTVAGDEPATTKASG